MRAFIAAFALALMPALVYADATSYAEAETGGFTIDTGDAIGAKVAAAILPTDDTTWEDIANDITGSINGGATIGQEGATGDIVAGARFTDFDGSNDVIDMGQSYTQGASPIVPNLGSASGPSSVFTVIDHDGNTGTLFSERDATPTVYQIYFSGSDAVSYRMGTTVEGVAGSVTTGVHTVATSHASADTFKGFRDGGLTITSDPSGTPDTNDINLSIGARWESYPTTGFQYGGKIYLVLLFNEDLSDSEQGDLDTNPWRVFNATAPSSATGYSLLQQINQRQGAQQ